MAYRRGFTLIELLLVMGILSILGAITIVAINPLKQLAQSRNAQRESDVRGIMQAIQQHSLDNQGFLAPGVDMSLRMIGSDATGCAVECPPGGEMTQDACIDLNTAVGGAYISALPHDPLIGSPARTYYAVRRTGDSRVLVRACAPELGYTMEVRE